MPAAISADSVTNHRVLGFSLLDPNIFDKHCCKLPVGTVRFVPVVQAASRIDQAGSLRYASFLCFIDRGAIARPLGIRFLSRQEVSLCSRN
jgi:hypothetical protein